MSETKWLVKSSGRVLGPLSLEQIAEQIRGRQFSIFDEVREPNSRWLIVREHPLLAQVVRQIRDEHASGAEPTQSTFNSGSKTLTSSVTERGIEETHLTPDPRDAGQVNIQARERTINSNGIGSRDFGVLADGSVLEKLQSSQRRWSFAVYTVVLLCALGAFYLWKSNKQTQLNAEQIEERLRAANDLAQRGDYGRSLEAIREAEKARPLVGAEILLKIKLLLVSEDESAIELSRSIDGLGGSAENVGVDADLLRGLAQARLKAWKEATALYDRVLQKSPKSAEAQLNKAAASVMIGDFSSAWNLLRNPHYNRFRSYYQVVKTFVALKLNDATARKQVLEEFKNFDVMDERSRGRDAGREFYFERVLLYTQLAQQAGEAKLLGDFRRKLSQANPFEVKAFLHAPLLDWQALDWRLLLPQCDAVKQGLRGDSSANGIWALCLAASGDLVSGLNVIDQSTRLYPEDTGLAGVSALLLLTAGRKTEAERVVATKPAHDRILVSWVRGVLCEERHDNACAEKAWESVRSLDAFEPRAFYGIAKAAKELGNDPHFISASTTGLRYAPNYRPLIQLTGGRDEF